MTATRGMERWATRVMVALVVLGGIGFGGGFAQARERPRGERRASLVWLLGQRQLELKKPVLEALGPEVAELLIDVANAPREEGAVRVRALAALGFFRTEAVRLYLGSLLRERSLLGEGLGLRLRRQAIRSLGWGFGERSVDELVGMKQDPEPQIREAVAQALGDSGVARVLPVLETWLGLESDFRVKAAVDQAVMRLKRRE